MCKRHIHLLGLLEQRPNALGLQKILKGFRQSPVKPDHNLTQRYPLMLLFLPLIKLEIARTSWNSAYTKRQEAHQILLPWEIHLVHLFIYTH